ncbi:SAM-dependent methyltransferase [Streptacidiphilus carbonis]|uniref:SAM-dependent methyltransferase n=1 Tax=Streptacidiphilus carbonis TaxID=105422 RepID=UPI000A49D276|nr:SAM-dependent methyltransferase [Streptacidiphilus carbonis]
MEGFGWMQHVEDPPDQVDLRTDVPSTARMYDYFLGGKDNFAVDREAAEQVISAFPAILETTRANRAFLGRAVRYAAREGVRQFLDIGTGIPTQANTDQVAHAVAPDARVLYVDNDPIVLRHADALMAQADGRKRTRVLLGDLRQPEQILSEARKLLDFDQPVALMLVAILHFIQDEEKPGEIVRSLVEALPPGSMLILSHATGDFMPDASVEVHRAVYRSATSPFVDRSRAEVAEFFEGLDLVEPGLVQLPWWRPDGAVPGGSERVSGWAGAAFKR